MNDEINTKNYEDIETYLMDREEWLTENGYSVHDVLVDENNREFVYTYDEDSDIKSKVFILEELTKQR